MAGFDAHTHLDFPEFDGQRHAVLQRAKAKGIEGALVAAADPQHHGRVRQVAQEHGLVYALGVHPWWAYEPADLPASPPPAIGEIGLDRLHPGFETQQVEVFRDWLGHARLLNRPVVLHCVRAAPEMLGILKRDGLPACGGMVHGWREGPVLTEAFLALGLHLSFGASLHRPKVLATAASLPLSRVLLESDCPHPHAAEPAAVAAFAAQLGTARDIAPDEVLAITGANARRLFS